MKSKNGISLIVLIVTIIVIIILAAVVILTLTKNNPIESAKEARFKEDVRTFQDELAMYIAKDYTSKAGQRNDKITATNYNPAGDPQSLYTYIPSFSKKYEGKFVIKNDELMYSEGKLTEEEQIWSDNLKLKLNQKTGAEKAKENPSQYYGQKVNYTTGNTEIDSDITEWKIFYSDGSNVYIISSGYVDSANLPQKDGVKPVQWNNENKKMINFNNISSKYNGSADITDERVKTFNRDYFKERISEETGEKYVFSSTNGNMKLVAYMLDYSIWNDFVNSAFAEYAVGGPSVEMTLKSYSEKKNVDYRSKASSATGYQISNDAGKENTWENYYDGMLSTSESLYVLPRSSGAFAMWLASPSAGSRDDMMYVGAYGYVGNGNSFDIAYSITTLGIRPLVCLNSNIMLNQNEITGVYEISQ